MKKIALFLLFTVGSLGFLSAQAEEITVTSDTLVSTQNTCIPVPLSHWSLGIFTGVNSYRLAPESPTQGDKLHMMGGVSLDYTVNTFAGIGVEYTFNEYSRPYIWDGYNYTLWANTDDILLKSTINLSNAFSPFRTGFWEYVSVYGEVGAGIAIYSAHSDISSTSYEEYCPVGKVGLTAEFSLSKTINLAIGAQFRQYDELKMSGISTSHRNAEAFIYTVGLNYKIGSASTKHARNTNLCSLTPKPLPTIVKTTRVIKEDKGTAIKLKTVEEENATLKRSIQKMTDDSKNAAIQQSLKAQNDALKTDLQNKKKEVINTSIQSSLESKNATLEQKLQKLDADLKRLATQKEGIVTLSLETIEFKTGSNNLTPASTILLDQVATILTNNSFWSGLKIYGHTDAVGSSASNQRLSNSRALAVKTYLLLKGVPSTNVVAIGMGENKPIDTNDTPEGRQNNRRVDFEFSK
jgi:outer membrane protein OmpA-like peptidoglycan-associated protein